MKQINAIFFLYKFIDMYKIFFQIPRIEMVGDSNKLILDGTTTLLEGNTLASDTDISCDT
jgi:high-affinity K+ transport system ATPase subunit B